MLRPSLCALLVTVGVHALGFAQTAGLDTRKDEEAIKAVIAGTTEAFSEHDAKACSILHS